MTYAEFLALFVGIPLVFSLVRHRAVLSRRGELLPLIGITCIVYAATSPWDNAAVAKGLWAFSEAQISGLRIGLLPVEEYAFFGLQTWLVGLWVVARLRGRTRGVA